MAEISSNSEEAIWIITEEVPQDIDVTGQKGNPYYPKPPIKKVNYQDKKVSVKKLENKMSEFLRVISGLLSRVQKQVPKSSGIQLDEIELSVEISGEGEVKLLGTGAKAGTKGAITLKFKRIDSQ